MLKYIEPETNHKHFDLTAENQTEDPFLSKHYMFKVNHRNTRRCVKYVLSEQ